MQKTNPVIPMDSAMEGLDLIWLLLLWPGAAIMCYLGWCARGWEVRRLEAENAKLQHMLMETLQLQGKPEERACPREAGLPEETAEDAAGLLMGAGSAVSK
jgi:hypothetical protein